MLQRRISAGLLIIWTFLAVSACGSTPLVASGSPAPIRIAAAENFYGNIASQLGGKYVTVTSVLSDPNVDPHEYQSNVRTSLMVSEAELVIENGAGYDDWMDKILAASPNSNRLLLQGYEVAPHRLPVNEHVWYSFVNIEAIAQAITVDLQKLDPVHAALFSANLNTFKQSLQPLFQEIAQIKTRYATTPVGLTETIYLYQTELEGLHVLTPFEFEKAVAEGNDPPADTIIAATDQITHHQIKVLIYNAQTITPVTTNLENLAQTNHIPVVPVTETMPPTGTYQIRMMLQLTALLTALGG